METAFNIIQLITDYIVIYAITHYVFMEKNQKGKRQIIYNLSALVVLVASFLLFGETVATGMLIIFGGLNIYLSRETNKLKGVGLIVPILGITDGILLPIVVLPLLLIDTDVNSSILYQTIMCSVIVLGYFAFRFFGSRIQDRFETMLDGRNLRSWEKILLCSVGVLLLIFSMILQNQANLKSKLAEAGIFEIPEALSDYIKYVVFLLGIISFVMTLTVIVVVIVGNRQNYYHSKIAAMQFNIIVMMAEIVENRDENTGGHIKRTAKYVEIIARELKKEGKYTDILTDSYINDLIVAAPLHDIGKIHVSDLILNKNGRLTDEEFEIMKTHSPAGRDLLKNARGYLGEFSYLDMAIDMAGYHHEWWTKSPKGYPDGITGEEIPLCARIMAVADVFDALISKRCYKDSMPLEKAYSIIRQESGTHFDPEIVTAFFKAQDKIEACLEEFEKEEA